MCRLFSRLGGNVLECPIKSVVRCTMQKERRETSVPFLSLTVFASLAVNGVAAECKIGFVRRRLSGEG